MGEGFLLFPYHGVLAYLIVQSGGMSERNLQRAEQARGELRRVAGYSVADEIEKLDRLKTTGRSAPLNVRDCAPGPSNSAVSLDLSSISSSS